MPFILNNDFLTTQYKVIADAVANNNNNNFILPDDKGKMKESKKVDKYLDLAWELKKLWNIMVTVIPIVIDVLGRRLKDLEIRKTKTIQTIALLRSFRILKRDLETWGDLGKCCCC